MMDMYSHILKKVKSYPTTVSWDRKSYMPVSMNNRLLRDPKTLEEILDWVFAKVDRVDFIIGDYLHRHNVMIAGKNEDEAVAISETLGTELESMLSGQKEKYPAKFFVFRHVKEFYDKPEFSIKLAYFAELHKRNEKFRKGVSQMVQTFLNRQGHIEATLEQISHCQDYLLEELVIFEMLADEGFLINVYPGKQLETFKEIVTGKLPNISPSLEKVSLVEMKFKFSSKTKK